MLFNFDESHEERKLPDSIKNYFFKRCDITQNELEELIKITEDIPFDVLISRLKIIAEFFYRLKKGKDTHKIHNEFAYAKKIIHSASFFENQRISHTIPNVKETEKYLKAIRERRQNNPGVNKEIFHKKVAAIRKLYKSLCDPYNGESTRKNTAANKEKMASVLRKLEDEEQMKKIESEITPIYKTLRSCQLDYRLFKITLLNIYLYHGVKAFQSLLLKVKEKKTLSIKELSELRQIVLEENPKEDADGN